MKTIATILVFTAISIAAASAQPGRGEKPGPREERGGPDRPARERLVDRLDLTPEQSKQLAELREQFRAETMDLRAAVEKARLEVNHQLRQESVDQAALMKAVETESAAHLAMRKATVQHQLKVRDIIGIEKAQKLQEMRQEWREDRRESRPGAGRP
ncbi:MAG TPA: periplasmic heavy metal sensor [Kiritimatiellia bacterium]|nr:periplasmic heavy metal sensor [Kiritimatiellia bacterium]